MNGKVTFNTDCFDVGYIILQAKVNILCLSNADNLYHGARTSTRLPTLSYMATSLSLKILKSVVDFRK